MLGPDDTFAARDRLPECEFEGFLRGAVEREVTEAVRETSPSWVPPVEYSFSEGRFETGPDLVEVDADRFERRGVLGTERWLGGTCCSLGAETVDREADLPEQHSKWFVRGDRRADEQMRRFDVRLVHTRGLLLRCHDDGPGTVGESFEHVDHLRFRLCF